MNDLAGKATRHSHHLMLDPGYAYIRIAQFQEDTGMEVKKKLAKLKGKQEAWRGAVLDLRSNPGGLLTSAVEISDEFLDQGTIVSTRGRLKQTDLSFSATPGDLLDGAPIDLKLTREKVKVASVRVRMFSCRALPRRAAAIASGSGGGRGAGAGVAAWSGRSGSWRV